MNSSFQHGFVSSVMLRSNVFVAIESLCQYVYEWVFNWYINYATMVRFPHRSVQRVSFPHVKDNVKVKVMKM